MFHMFDTEIATRYGINAAVIFQNIAFWCNHSRANGTNYFDGLYWTYNSVKAFQDLFPYLGKSQISSALQKLLDEGLIVKGNYNKVAYDRTAWYAVTEFGDSMFRKPNLPFTENQQMDLSKIGNGNIENRKPIPDINTDKKQDISISRKRADKDIPAGFTEFYNHYPKKVSKATAVKAWKKLNPDQALLNTILNDIRRRLEGVWKGKELQYIPNPSTYINQRRWEDEIATGNVEEEPVSVAFKDLPREEQQRLEEKFADEYWAARGK